MTKRKHEVRIPADRMDAVLGSRLYGFAHGMSLELGVKLGPCLYRWHHLPATGLHVYELGHQRLAVRCCREYARATTIPVTETEEMITTYRNELAHAVGIPTTPEIS